MRYCNLTINLIIQVNLTYTFYKYNYKLCDYSRLSDYKESLYKDLGDYSRICEYRLIYNGEEDIIYWIYVPFTLL